MRCLAFFSIRCPAQARPLPNAFCCTGPLDQVELLCQLMRITWVDPVQVCALRLGGSERAILEVRSTPAVTRRRVASVLYMLPGHEEYLRTLKSGPAFHVGPPPP